MPTAVELAIDTSASDLQLAQTIFGAGIQVVDATFRGDANAAGIYSGADTTTPGVAPSDSGVILSTGSVGIFTNGSGTTNTNTQAGAGANNAGGIDGDADMNSVSGQSTFDGAIFEAVFIPEGDYITMQFVFTSDEYPEYVNLNVNDSFGVWVNGQFVEVTITSTGNVAIDTVNANSNQNLYIDNTADQFNTEMDGFTYTLSLKAPVNPGVENTIKIGIADGGDAVFDSNLLIAADSIQTVALAFDDQVQLTANSTRIVDVLANDRDLYDTGLTITEIMGQPVVPGQTITVSTGERITLNPDGTLTVQSDGDIGSNVITYAIVDGNGNTDVGYLTIRTVATAGPDGVVQGTGGGDLIDLSYTGDPDGDRVDNADGLGVGGTTGDGDYILAGAGDDTILASAGADAIFADDGNDSIDAGGGNDTVSGGAGDDTVFGWGGDDTVYLGAGNDSFGTFQGDSAGNDSVYGGSGNDAIIGGAGNDYLEGGSGNDSLSGGIGADTILGGDGADSFNITEDHEGDTILGGEGGVDQDTIWFGNFVAPSGVNVTFTDDETGTYQYFTTTGAGTFSQIEGLSLTGNADSVDGSATSEGIAVQGQGGDDTVTGGSGRDVIDGGTGDDSLTGGLGNDTILGGDGDDTIAAGPDFPAFADYTVLTGTAQTVTGTNGNTDFDHAVTSNEGVPDTLTVTIDGGVPMTGYHVGNGADANETHTHSFTQAVSGVQISLVGIDLTESAVIWLDGVAVDLNVAIANGWVTFDPGTTGFAIDAGGAIVATSGPVAEPAPAVLTILQPFTTLAVQNVSATGAGDGFVYDIAVDTNPPSLYAGDADSVDGGAGNDSIATGAGADTVLGGTGNDTVDGGIGNDSLSGGDGNDSLSGGEGDDTLLGDAGNDTLAGGEGADVLSGGADRDSFIGFGADTITGGETGDDLDRLDLTDVASISFSGPESGTVTFNDGSILTFSEIEEVYVDGTLQVVADGIVQGTAGDDTMTPGYTDGQGDQIDGADGDDDTILGGDGNDSIEAGAGNDSVFGGAGADTLIGGLGNDTLSGDVGADRFVYTGAFGADTVSGGQDHDIIDLSGHPNPVSVVFTAPGAGTITDTVTGETITFDSIETLILTPESDVVDATANDGYTYVQTRGGNDQVTGSTGNDIFDDEAYLPNGQGNDTFYGGDGNDTLWMGTDDDVVYGGDGDDSLGGEEGNDTIFGGAGNDSLMGHADADVFYGGAGDTVEGGEAGLDNDTLVLDWSTVQTITYGGGNNESGTITFFGGGTLTFTGIENLVADGPVDGTAGNDTMMAGYTDGQGDQVDGTDGLDDTIFGNGGDDFIEATLGNDTVYGGSGNDNIFGGVGENLLHGDDGNDFIWTDNSNDTLSGLDDTVHGGVGDDTLYARYGNDIIYGGTGNDVMHGGPGADTVYGEDGNDELNGGVDDAVDLFYGGANDDVLRGDGGNDLLYAGTGNDTVYGGADDDLIEGAEGNDQLYGDGGNDSMTGGDGSDLLQGGAGDDTLDGGAQADDVIGGAGNDSLSGGDGGDFVDGGDGADTLDGGQGPDAMFGGADADTFTGARDDFVDGGEAVTTGTDADSLYLTGVLSVTFDPGNRENGTVTFTDGGTLTFVNIETVYVDGVPVSPPDQVVEGTGGDDVIDGAYAGDPEGDLVDASDNLAGTNDDLIEAYGGNDAVTSGDGDDTIHAGTGEDTVTAGAGNDVLLGEDGNDSLSGDAGNDSLTGGAGADRMDGGGGDDRFVLGDGFGNDLIYGGETAETTGDTLDASSVTADVVLDLTEVDPANPEDGTIEAGVGNVTVFEGIETFVLGSGDDRVFGSDGADSVAAGAGADTVDGGAGDDRFDLGGADGVQDLALLGDGDGDDTLSGFEAPVDNGDGTFTGRDQLDVSGLTDAGGLPVNVADVVVTDTNGDGTGDAILTFPDGTSVTLAGIQPPATGLQAWLQALGIPLVTTDYIVEGTGGGDVIDGTYTGDPEGDRVDAGDSATGTDDDRIEAYGGNDTVRAGAGNDTVLAGTGDDSLRGGAGDDSLLGEDGSDTMVGDADHDVIDGGADRDHLYGGTGNDTLIGGDGNDFIRGDEGNDIAFGGSGNDQYIFDNLVGHDTFVGGEVQDGTGDIVFASGGLTPMSVVFTGDEAGTLTQGSSQVTFSEVEMVWTGHLSDSIDATATTSGINLFSGWGNDTILGGSGNDTIDGYAAADRIDAGAGNDEIRLGLNDAAVDTLVLGDGDGDDTVHEFEAPVANGDGTFTGRDQLDVGGLTDAGGQPVDTADVTVTDSNGDGTGDAILTFPDGTSVRLVGVVPPATGTAWWLNAMGIPMSPDFVVEGTGGADVIDGAYLGDPEGDRVDAADAADGSENDLIEAYGGNDTVRAGAGSDTVDGGAGDDSLEGGAGIDSILGGDGSDLIFGGSEQGTLQGDAGNDTIIGGDDFDVISGGTGDDSIDGGAESDVLTGGAGHDTMLGGTGNDFVFGEAGNDLIDGGSGNDSLTGEDGNDTLTGGAGADTLRGGADHDSLSGGDDDDSLTGDAGNDTLLGEGGNDTLIAGTGADSLYGGDGDDVLTVASGSGSQSDLLDGGAGNDTITGQDGRDTIIGGAGNDQMSGGLGDDTFVLTDGFGADTVAGGAFNEISGGDTLDGTALTGDVVVDLSAGGAADPEDGTLTMGGDTVTFQDIEVVLTGAGDDRVTGSTGNDTVGTGAGADTLDGGAGNDYFHLGTADGAVDVVVLADGGGADRVVAFEAPIDNGDGTFTGRDQLSVTDLTDAGGQPVNTADVVVTDTNGNGTGNAILTFPDGTSIQLIGIAPPATNVAAWLEALGIPPGPDEVVEGTGGDDLIDGAYTGDPEGDLVDAADNTAGTDDDVIEAYGGNDTVNAGAGSDLVYGGAGDDVLRAGSGNDTLLGEAGNDELQTGLGNDQMQGGAGSDVFQVFAGSGSDTITGGETAETGMGDILNIAIGTAGATVTFTGNEAGTMTGGGTSAVFSEIETVISYAGNDTIDGSVTSSGLRILSGDGDDSVTGGTGNDDFLLAGGADVASAGDGADTVRGDAGNDTIDGGAGNDQLFGGNDDDRLEGDAGNDQLNGDAGNDLLSGGLGNDSLFGGTEDDTLSGDDGNDELYGGSGNDSLLGGVGNDSLLGGAGNDLLSGEDGNDSLLGSDGRDTLTGGLGDDTLSGGADADTFFGGVGDVVTGGETFTPGGSDNDTLVLNQSDVLSITYGGGNNEAGVVTFVGGGTLTFAEIENVTFAGPVDGSAGSDVMGVGYTDPNGDQIDGSDGDNDTIFGHAGDDTITAGVGNDTVYGGIGNDSIDGDIGNDVIHGDDGNDRIESGTGNDVTYGGDGNDTISNIGGFDQVYGGAGNDSLTGGLGLDTFYGGSGDDTLNDAGGANLVDMGDGNDFVITGWGNDTINGGAGNDSLIGDAGDDLIYGDADNDTLRGETGNDQLFGGTGNDSLRGGSGEDTLTGDIGNDILRGEAGNDIAYGGDGADRFIFEAGLGNDTFIGGETGDGTGDVVQGTFTLGAQTVVFTGNEAGTLTEGTTVLTFSEVEQVLTGGFADSVDATATTGGVNLVTNAGADTVLGGAGNDTVDAGTGADVVAGGAGNDTILLGLTDAAVDTVVLADGGGADTLQQFEAPVSNGDGTFTGRDQLDVSGLTDAGGQPVNTADVVVTDTNGNGTGSAILTFPDGTSVTLTGVVPPVTNVTEWLVSLGIPAGPDEVVEGTGGDDVIDGAYLGDPEGDRVDASDNAAGTNDDVIEAYGGNDMVLAGSGNDQIQGGAGNDTLDGGAGDDRIFGGAGADSVAGGDDRDTIYVAATGDGAGDTVDGGNGGDDYDTLDLRGSGPLQITYTTPDRENGTVTFLDVNGNPTGTLTFTDIENVIPCFTPGALIATDRGEVRVEDLQVGDRVLTRDSGYQEIRWIGRRDLTEEELRARPEFRPVRIGKGSLGLNLPERDLTVSPQHRMLMTGSRAELLFGEHEVLVAATHLEGRRGIARVGEGGASYIHLLFDQHEIIRANGAWTESFQPGEMTLAGMDDGPRAEVLALFPELTLGILFPAARMTLRRKETILLLQG